MKCRHKEDSMVGEWTTDYDMHDFARVLDFTEDFEQTYQQCINCKIKYCPV